MTEKYKNKFRSGTFRAYWWDYGWNGAYFVTICTQNREHFFGEIINGEMTLSKTGVIATDLWNEIPKHHEFVQLGEFVVMPNHIHGILIINKPNFGDTDHGNVRGNDHGNVRRNVRGNDHGNVRGNVGTGHALSLRNTLSLRNPLSKTNPLCGPVSFQKPQPTNRNHNIQNNTNRHELPGSKRFQNIGKNTVSSIVGSYKSAVTKYANQLGFPNGWQRLFHEHIIRNQTDHQRISHYIINNPMNWEKDQLYKSSHQ